MKIVYIALFSFLCSTIIHAQDAGTSISTALITGKYPQPQARDFSHFSYSGMARAQSAHSDTVSYNMYGDLRKDNPEYNQKTPLWSVAARVTLNNVVVVSFDRYVLNADYARVGFQSWKHNVETGWEWDVDRFGMNYFLHPYSGSGYFNAARSNGYSYYESLPFTLGGSVMYEYLGENTLPSINDVINTTVTGAFLGEISYRLSSVFLDDQTTGAERFWRELFAGIINPQRAFSRLLRGRFTRGTEEEIYQKEPLNMTFSAGPHLVNDGRTFGTGSANGMLTLHLDYGNPFERRSRRLFDYFKLRADLTIGAGRKFVDNVIGHGLLFGGNAHIGNMEMLVGAFQHYDFWDNKTFELGTIAFGPGIISKLPLSSTANLYFDAHVGLVPLAGNGPQLGPDTSQFRDYNYGGGAETKFEATLNLGGWVSATFRGYYYMIHTYVGSAGNNFVGILKPSIAFQIVDNVSLGFEQLVYLTDRYPRDYVNVHDVRTEQKVFVQVYIENFKNER